MDSMRAVHECPPARGRLRYDINSVFRHKTHRRIRLGYLSRDRIEDCASAICRRLPARELNPDVGQPETIGDPPLWRHDAVRGYAAVVHAHAAVHEDRVKVGLSII